MADNDDLTASLKSAGYDFDDVRDRQALANYVGCRPDDLAALTARLKQVQMLALNEWLGWAGARGRFNSLSELDTSRVLDLFLTVRQEAPTVEALVEQLAIPQGRATSMIGRMKYGKARELMKMSFVHALREVQQRLDDEAIVDYSRRSSSRGKCWSGYGKLRLKSCWRTRLRSRNGKRSKPIPLDGSGAWPRLPQPCGITSSQNSPKRRTP